MADTLDGIEVFVTVVRSRSFTGAAERLGVSKSAVGKSVARLEHRLGTLLFYRTTRKLSLTVDGEAFYRACSQALDEIAHAEGALASTGAAPTGRLRIDMPAAFGRRILLPVLLDIARPHPALQLALSFGDRIIDPISEAVDLVLRFGEPADQAGLVMRKLTEQRLCICASPAYLAAQGIPQSLDELDQSPLHRQHQARQAFLLARRRRQPRGASHRRPRTRRAMATRSSASLWQDLAYARCRSAS